MWMDSQRGKREDTTAVIITAVITTAVITTATVTNTQASS